jgi:cell division protein ZapB
MDPELLDSLEKRVESLLEGYSTLKRENVLLREENQRLLGEREGFKARIDVVLKKLEGI